MGQEHQFCCRQAHGTWVDEDPIRASEKIPLFLNWGIPHLGWQQCKFSSLWQGTWTGIVLQRRDNSSSCPSQSNKSWSSQSPLFVSPSPAPNKCCSHRPCGALQTSALQTDPLFVLYPPTTVGRTGFRQTGTSWAVFFFFLCFFQNFTSSYRTTKALGNSVSLFWKRRKNIINLGLAQ